MINQAISHYRILRKLGAGGMGEVYLAEDTKLNRKVALKFLPLHAALTPERMRRFHVEARAAATLHHGNIVHIYEIGEADGKTFIAMEFIDGQTLQERISGGPLDTNEVLRVGIETADALEEAHNAGITHRDIKPANIMITSLGKVKVLDFGLAKVRQTEFENAASGLPTAVNTTPGVVMGTVEYMSPEQALGHHVDHRTDIFSLGVALYEMTTGKRPFTAATPTEMVDRILHAQPEATGRLTDGSPAELERIIRKCLEKERERRYQSARELLTDLRNLQRDITLPLSIQRRGRQTPMLARRHLYVPLALAVLTLIGFGFFRLVTRHKVIDSVAVLPFANTSADASMEYLSDGITENLINRLSRLPALRVVPRSTVFRYKGQEIDPQAAGRALGVRAVIVGRVVQRGDTLQIGTELIDVVNESQLWGEQYSRRLADLLTIEEDIARGIAEKLRSRLSDTEQHQLTRRFTESNKAHELYLRGRYFWNKRTEQGMRKGIEYFREAIELDPAYSLAYVGLADSYNFLGAFGIAVLPPREAMPKAKAAAMKALEIDDSLAEAHTSIAFVRLYYDWDWPGAERGFQRAIELNPNYAPAHQWYSHLLMAKGKTSESIAEARRAAELDPLSLPANMNLGWQYYWARNYDLAVEHLRKTLEMDRNFEQGHWALGWVYEAKGMFEEAAAEFTEATALSGGTPVPLAALGHAYAVSGKKAEAIRLREQLEEQSKLRYVSPYWMATLCAGLGEHSQAFSWLERAYEERSGGLIWLAVDPRMDGLRSDFRFSALKQRVGLQ